MTALESAQKALAELFEQAQSEIFILSRNPRNRLYDKKELLSSLENCGNRGVRIEIIVGPEIDPEGQYNIAFLHVQGIQLYKIERPPSAHFIIIDDKHVVVGAPHRSDDSYRATYTVKNTIMLAQRLRIYFTSLKSRAQPIYPENY